jgi:hypothetical protein
MRSKTRHRRIRRRSSLAADGDSTYLALSGVVGHAEAAVIEEAGERRPPVANSMSMTPALSSVGAGDARPWLRYDLQD